MLIGAMLLEAYAVGSLLLSDWAYLWFSHNSSKIPLFGSRLDSSLRPVQKGKRWSNSMYQYSLLDFCLNLRSSAFQKISWFIPLPNRVKNLWEKWQGFRQLKRVKVSPELKSFIFTHLKEKSNDPELGLKELLTCRGAVSLRKHSKNGIFEWAVDVEFDHSILIWHIATDICYNLNETKRGRHSDSHGNEKEWYNNNMKFSKNLADYMLYILLVCPFMLLMRNGLLRFSDTCANASLGRNKLKAYEKLGQINTEGSPSKEQGIWSLSALFEARKLAALLNEMDSSTEMWKMVCDVWVEMLGYAASQCRGYDHAQQLEKGGELLTHVWLLMEHLGISEHFMLSKSRG